MPALYPMQDRIGRVGAYLLDDGDGLTLIDALSKADGRTVLAELARIGRPVTDLRRILLTHAHVTHVKGAAALQRASGATVAGPAEERDIIEGRAASGGTTLVPQRPWHVLPQQYLLNLSPLLWRLRLRPGLLFPPPVTLDHVYEDGERIGPVHVIRTPGHSPGSTCFYWPEMEALFVGDAIVTWPRYELGWKGLTEDFPENVRSVRRLLAICRDRGWRIRRIAPGHGGVHEMADGNAELGALVAASGVPED